MARGDRGAGEMAARIEEGEGIVAVDGWRDGANPVALLVDRRNGAGAFAVVGSGCAVVLVGGAAVASRGDAWAFALAVGVVVFAGETVRRWLAASQGSGFAGSGMLAEVMASPLDAGTVGAGLLFPWLHARQVFLLACAVAAGVADMGASIAGGGSWGLAGLSMLAGGVGAYALSSKGGVHWCGYDDLADVLRPPELGRAVGGAARVLAGVLVFAALRAGVAPWVDRLGAIGPVVQSFGVFFVAGGLGRRIRQGASRRVRSRVGGIEGILGAALEGRL